MVLLPVPTVQVDSKIWNAWALETLIIETIESRFTLSADKALLKVKKNITKQCKMYCYKALQKIVIDPSPLPNPANIRAWPELPPPPRRSNLVADSTIWVSDTTWSAARTRNEDRVCWVRLCFLDKRRYESRQYKMRDFFWKDGWSLLSCTRKDVR